MKLLFALFISLNLSAQIGVGDWRLHVSNNSAIDVVEGNNVVYTAFKNGLLEYDVASAETSLWTDANALSDVSLSCLEFHSAQNAVYIGYENGNIDKIVDNTVLNIPAIRLAQVQGSKRINKIQAFEGKVYISTGFSIVVLDPVKNEVIDSYYPTDGDAPILDVSFRNDSIFALTETTLYKGFLKNPSLADPAQWSVVSSLKTLAAPFFYKEIEVINNELFVLQIDPAYGNDSVFHLKNSGTVLVNDFSFGLEILSLENLNNRLTLNLADGIFIYKNDFSTYTLDGSWTLFNVKSANSFISSDGTIWIADLSSGLVKLANNVTSKISFVGPPKDSFYKMDCFEGNLVIAGGGRSGNQMTYNPSGIYLFEDENWSLINKNNQSYLTGKDIWDFLCVAVNPVNVGEIAAGTYSGESISIIKNGAVTETFNPNNSILETTPWNTAALISNVEYDDKGNLWVGNSFCDQLLKVYTKDHLWYSMSLGSSTIDKSVQCIAIDYNGNKWISVMNVGIVAYNDNGTIENTADDKIKLLNTGETSGALPSNDVKSIVADLDNNIWIGTDNGFAILYNSANVFDATAGNYNAQRIKVEVEGDVEYLLGGTSITDIEIDGGNRKWIGTDNSGVFLLSAEGTEIISNFTRENSHLISNHIEDMAFDHKTGELFMITDNGLISYRTDASAGDAEYSDVKVFPNPVKPGYAGLITIQGIKFDSDVRVTDVAGNLVYKTTSNGGTATWNGKTLEGENVKAGVYLFWTAPNDSEAKGRKVGKVVVIN
jgi:ligand-binding sensor domain-containing protein